LAFGRKINDILGASIEFRVAALAPEALDLTDGHALHADFAQGIANIIESKGFYNSGDKLHTVVLRGDSAWFRMLAIRLAYVYN